MIAEYVNNMPPGHARVRMEEVRAHIGQTHFAWIANTQFATISRLDTRDGRQSAEYDSVLRDGRNGGHMGWALLEDGRYVVHEQDGAPVTLHLDPTGRQPPAAARRRPAAARPLPAELHRCRRFALRH